MLEDELTDDDISFQALARWMGKLVLLGVVGTISFWLVSSWSNEDQHAPVGLAGRAWQRTLSIVLTGSAPWRGGPGNRRTPTTKPEPPP